MNKLRVVGFCSVLLVSYSTGVYSLEKINEHKFNDLLNHTAHKVMKDSDGDGLDDQYEFSLGLDPESFDSDMDGFQIAMNFS